jgi:hypothetical protein
MVETRLQARMNEWMNGKSIEQNGWNKILSKNEWMNDKTIEQIILSFKKSRMNEKLKSIEQNGWNKILSKNERMNDKTIEQIILSFKNSRMNEKLKVMNKMDEQDFKQEWMKNKNNWTKWMKWDFE